MLYVILEIAFGVFSHDPNFIVGTLGQLPFVMRMRGCRVDFLKPGKTRKARGWIGETSLLGVLECLF